MTVSVTELEAKALTHYAYDEMNQNNGAQPESADDVDCYLWVDQLAAALDIKISAAKGVVGSLTAKGLISIIQEDDPNDTGICFTEEGFNAWKLDHQKNCEHVPIARTLEGTCIDCGKKYVGAMA